MGERPDGFAALVARMESDLTELHDARRYFHATYLRTTRAVAQEVQRGGFRDADWVESWDLAFAQLYLDALDADRRGDRTSASWRVAFDAARAQPDAPPLRHVLFGLNAHINFDLPQALIAVITPADFDDPRVLASRQADHQHIDTVLRARIGAEDDELTTVSKVTVLDRALRPANRAASRRLLTEAREKVWRNTFVLDRARRDSDARYAATRSALETLCEERVRDLTRPGFVLLRLPRRGFGVLLPGA